MLAAAAAEVDKAEQNGARLTILSRHEVGVAWQGPAQVDGRPWPVRDATTVWLPAGSHVVEPASKDATLRIVDFNGELRSASVSGSGITLSYRSSSRAMAALNARPSRVQIDGASTNPTILVAGENYVLLLPRGQHFVEVE